MGFTVSEFIQCHGSNMDWGRGGKSVSYIAVHYTGTNASGHNNLVYFSGPNRNASAHYFVDTDGTISQSVSERDTAWAVGNYDRNQRSISIECVSDGSAPFTAAQIASLRAIVTDLMYRYGITADRVIRHYDVTGKHCPAQYVDESAWAALKNQITSTYVGEPKWVHSPNGWWYQRSDGSYPANEWMWVADAWYWFNGQGYMETGWHWINGKCYYLSESDDTIGKMVSGMQTINGAKYFFAPTGELQFGWIKYDGHWYVTDDKWGIIQTSQWYFKDNTWYWLDGDGHMVTGHQTIDGKQYLFDDSGAMQTGLREVEGDTYLFSESGSMVTDTLYINPDTKKLSAFDHDGRMIKNHVLSVNIDENGTVTGIKSID